MLFFRATVTLPQPTCFFIVITVKNLHFRVCDSNGHLQSGMCPSAEVQQQQDPHRPLTALSLSIYTYIYLSVQQQQQP